MQKTINIKSEITVPAVEGFTLKLIREDNGDYLRIGFSANPHVLADDTSEPDEAWIECFDDKNGNLFNYYKTSSIMSTKADMMNALEQIGWAIHTAKMQLSDAMINESKIAEFK